MRLSGNPPPLLQDLFLYCGARHRDQVLFREPNMQALQTLMDLKHEEW